MDEYGNDGNVGFEGQPGDAGITRQKVCVGGGGIEPALGEEPQQASVLKASQGLPERLHVASIAVHRDALHGSADLVDEPWPLVVFAGHKVPDDAEVGPPEGGKMVCPEQNRINGTGVVGHNDGGAVFWDGARVVLLAVAEEQAMQNGNLVAQPGRPADLTCANALMNDPRRGHQEQTRNG